MKITLRKKKKVSFEGLLSCLFDELVQRVESTKEPFVSAEKEIQIYKYLVTMKVKKGA